MELDRRKELRRQHARETRDPATTMAIDAESEILARQLPDTAHALIWDAFTAAGQGISKERWILEALTGHAGDDGAQRGCLRHIIALWSDGPWQRENVQ